MKYPKICYRFGRRGILNKKKEASVDLEIYFQRKRKFISTGIYVTQDQWSEDRGVVNRPDSLSLNIKLRDFRKPYEDYINYLSEHHLPFSFQSLEQHIEITEGGGSFVDFVAGQIEDRSDICESTKKTHRKLITALSEFGKIVSFADLTPANIRAYDNWLHKKYSVQTTISSYHKFLKVYIHIAMAMDLMIRDPYIGIKIERGRSKERKYLEEYEIRAIEDLELADPCLSRVRDLFLFQCYTGLAYADLERFDFSKARYHNDKYIIREKRKKSGVPYSIILLSPALRILEKYNYQLPMLSNQKYNAYLKSMACCAGIRFNLTSHVGRHTYATWCLNKGIPVETVARMLGHTNIQTTQIYAKILDKTLEKAFDILESSL